MKCGGFRNLVFEVTFVLFFSSVKSFRIWNCIKLKNETVALNNHNVDDETITKTSLKILNNKSTHKSKALNKNKTEIFLGVPGLLWVIVINARRCYNRSKISAACGFSTFWLWTFQFPLATKKDVRLQSTYHEAWMQTASINVPKFLLLCGYEGMDGS